MLSRRRKWIVRGTGLVLLLSVIYVASFFVLRKSFLISFFVPPTGLQAVEFYYFSSHGRTHRILYYLYFPIHRGILSGLNREEFDDTQLKLDATADAYYDALRKEQRFDDAQLRLDIAARAQGVYLERIEEWADDSRLIE